MRRRSSKKRVARGEEVAHSVRSRSPHRSRGDPRRSARTRANEERDRQLADLRGQVVSIAVAMSQRLIGAIAGREASAGTRQRFLRQSSRRCALAERASRSRQRDAAERRRTDDASRRKLARRTDLHGRSEHPRRAGAAQRRSCGRWQRPQQPDRTCGSPAAKRSHSDTTRRARRMTTPARLFSRYNGLTASSD